VDLLVTSCPGGTVVTKTTCQTLSPGAYERMAKNIVGLYHRLNSTCEGMHCETADFTGCILRLVGHDLMDYDPSTGKGGTDACIDFEDSDNKGLQPCLAGQGAFGKRATIEEAYKDFCHEVSLADFLVVAAETMMTLTRPDWDASSLKSPSLDFGATFLFGRATAATCEPGALPNPADSCVAVKHNFVDHLGLNWTEATALMGVHTLGRAMASNSGFDGWWVHGKGNRHEGKVFDHTYYVNLLGAGWVPAQVNGSSKHQWVRSDSGSKLEMMLNTDMCLAWNTNSGCKAEEDKDCCLWASGKFKGMPGPGGLGGAPSVCLDEQSFAPKFEDCCHKDHVRCGTLHMEPVGADSEGGKESAAAVVEFAKSDARWLEVFKAAWHHVTARNGLDELFSGACAEHAAMTA